MALENIIMDSRNVLKLAASIAICQLAGVAGSAFTFSKIPTWYASINKPAFVPPNWLFGPVWITLYTLMGISLFLVLQKGMKEKDARIALLAFGTQLFLNSLWSVLFFGINALLVAFVEIIALWAAILASIMLFCRISKRAGYLLVPYIIWVSIAALLNLSVWLLNP